MKVNTINQILVRPAFKSNDKAKENNSGTIDADKAKMSFIHSSALRNALLAPLLFTMASLAPMNVEAQESPIKTDGITAVDTDAVFTNKQIEVQAYGKPVLKHLYDSSNKNIIKTIEYVKNQTEYEARPAVYGANLYFEKLVTEYEYDDNGKLATSKTKVNDKDTAYYSVYKVADNGAILESKDYDATSGKILSHNKYDNIRRITNIISFNEDNTIKSKSKITYASANAKDHTIKNILVEYPAAQKLPGQKIAPEKETRIFHIDKNTGKIAKEHRYFGSKKDEAIIQYGYGYGVNKPYSSKESYNVVIGGQKYAKKIEEFYPRNSKEYRMPEWYPGKYKVKIAYSHSPSHVTKLYKSKLSNIPNMTILKIPHDGKILLFNKNRKLYDAIQESGVNAYDLGDKEELLKLNLKIDHVKKSVTIDGEPIKKIDDYDNIIYDK